MTLPRKIDLVEAFGRIPAPWNPHVAGDVNDCQVKLAKLEGEFVWHAHEAEDELFLVVRGSFTMRFREGDQELSEGQLLIRAARRRALPRGPRGVLGPAGRAGHDAQHRPARERAHAGRPGAALSPPGRPGLQLPGPPGRSGAYHGGLSRRARTVCSPPADRYPAPADSSRRTERPPPIAPHG